MSLGFVAFCTTNTQLICFVLFDFNHINHSQPLKWKDKVKFELKDAFCMLLCQRDEESLISLVIFWPQTSECCRLLSDWHYTLLCAACKQAKNVLILPHSELFAARSSHQFNGSSQNPSFLSKQLEVSKWDNVMWLPMGWHWLSDKSVKLPLPVNVGGSWPRLLTKKIDKICSFQTHLNVTSYSRISL